MMSIFKNKQTLYKVYAALTFVVLLVISQLLVYQQYAITRDREQTDLQYQLEDTHEKFETMLHHNILSANTIAMLYYQDPTLSWFDSTGKGLMRLNPALDLVEFLDDSFITTHIYPLKGYERYLGDDPLADPVRRAETLRAVEQKDLQFAGPFPMRFTNEKAIAGRQAIFWDGRFAGIAVVVTKLSTIAKVFPELQNKGKFVFQLSKVSVVTGKREYFFEGYTPKDGTADSVVMPSTDWTLHAAYAESYSPVKTVWFLALFALLFSAAVATFVYFKTHETIRLEESVKGKTHALQERMKELSAIFQVSEVLKDERQSVSEAFGKVVSIIPVGWQHSDVCAARIVVGTKVYATDNFTDSPYAMRAPLQLIDGRPGCLEVVYCTEMPPEDEGPFITAERDLINTLADMLKLFYNKKFHSERCARSEASMRSMIEATPVAIMLLDKEFNIVALNSVMSDKCNEVLGTQLKVGDSFIEALLPERRDEVRANFTRVMEDLEPVSYEAVYDLPAGRVYLHVIATPVTCNAEPMGIATSVYDTTKRRKREQQNRNVINGMVQRMARLLDFALQLTRKMREPLSVIKQLVARAKEEKNENKRAELLDDISEKATGINSMMKELEVAMENKDDKEVS